MLGRLAADGDQLQRHHVVAVVPRAEVVGQAQPLVAILPREGEPHRRAAPRVGYDHVVAVGGRREVAVHRARHDPAVAQRLLLHAPTARGEVLLQQTLPLLAANALSAPGQLEQRALVHQREHQLGVDPGHHAGTDEGRPGHRGYPATHARGRRRRGGGGARAGRRRVARAGCLLPPLPQRGGRQVGGPPPPHQPLERVLAVEDAGLVGASVVEERDPAAEGAVDRRAADQHRQVQAAAVELVHAERHLLRGRDQQRREADRVGATSDALSMITLTGTCLPRSYDGVAVVGEDRVDQVLADVVHVAVHGRQHHLALRLALDLLEVTARGGRPSASSPRPTAARTAGSARRGRSGRRRPSWRAAAPCSAARRRRSRGARVVERPRCRPRCRPLRWRICSVDPLVGTVVPVDLGGAALAPPRRSPRSGR